MMEYDVETLRESWWSGSQPGQKLKALLNERARAGWKVLHILEADVKSRTGLGNKEGLLVVFERSS
jgi:Domain of unknown function (DUF4177)